MNAQHTKQPSTHATAANNAGQKLAGIPALDGLRGIAILLVIPHNANLFSHAAWWLWPVALLAHAGWLGVHLFFVLSGFLITRNLLESRDSANYFSSFYARRALRIVPLYFATLFVFLILAPLVFAMNAKTSASYHNQIWLWTFLNNWVQPSGIDVGGFTHFWSLAVEEQFYLFWPFVVLLFTGVRLLWICAGLTLFAFVVRLAILRFGGNPEMLYMFTICRMDALVIGAAAAALMRSTDFCNWLKHRQRWLLPIAASLLILIGLTTHTFAAYDPRTLDVGYPTLAIAFALIIVAVAMRQTNHPTHWLNALLSTSLLRSVGRYSYAMYIFHMLILIGCGATVQKVFAFTGAALPLVYALVAVLLSYAAGFLSYHLLEKHFLRLKIYFEPQLSSTQPAQAPT